MFIRRAIIEHRLYAGRCHVLGAQWDTKPGGVPASTELRGVNQGMAVRAGVPGAGRRVGCCCPWLFLDTGSIGLRRETCCPTGRRAPDASASSEGGSLLPR